MPDQKNNNDDSNGDVVVTLYFANGTDQTVVVEEIEDLCITDGDMVFTDVSAYMGNALMPGEGLVYELTIPCDYVAGYGWNQPAVSAFRVVTEVQQQQIKYGKDEKEETSLNPQKKIQTGFIPDRRLK